MHSLKAGCHSSKIRSCSPWKIGLPHLSILKRFFGKKIEQETSLMLKSKASAFSNILIYYWSHWHDRQQLGEIAQVRILLNQCFMTDCFVNTVGKFSYGYSFMSLQTPTFAQLFIIPFYNDGSSQKQINWVVLFKLHRIPWTTQYILFFIPVELTHWMKTE